MNQIIKYLEKKGYQMDRANGYNYMVYVPYKESEKVSKYLRKHMDRVKVRYTWNYDSAIFYI